MSTRGSQAPGRSAGTPNNAGAGAGEELVAVGPPPALRWNIWATAVWCVMSVVSNVVLFGQRPYLRKVLIDANAKAKKPVADYAAHVDSHVQSGLIGGLIRSLLVVVIIMLLALLTWRGKRIARWGLVAMATVPGVFLGVGIVGQLVIGTLASAPGVFKATLIAAGFASVVVLVLLFQRTTRQYFTALKQTQRGNVPAVPGARPPSPRPVGGGLGSLFAPRRRPAPIANDSVVSRDDGADALIDEPTSGGGASRRPKPTRPGSVKPKSTGNRPGRFKSRQQ